VARRKRAETGAGDDTGSGAGADGAPGVDGGTAAVADLEVPVGGVTVRGPGTAGGQHSANHVQVVDVANVAVPKLVLAEHPVVTPSAPAVQCVTGVLEGLAERNDLRDFLHQLVNDSLLLHAQFLGGARATFSAGFLSADLELSWPGVQRFMKRWWPVWEVPPDGAATILPPPWDCGGQGSPHAAVASKWMMNVVMNDINPVLLRTTSTCRWQFKKDLLDVVTVVRVGLGATYPVSVALATMLLVATHEELYGTVLADLVAVGRPPVPTVATFLSWMDWGWWKM